MTKNQYRFFVSSDVFQGQKAIISDQGLIHQITKVLRLKIGDQIILLDNSGFEYLINLEKADRKIEGLIVKKNENKNEPIKKIILCQSLLKSDRFEQVLKFCTNLGIGGFIPFVSQNSIIKELNHHKFERYHKIIQESAEQSSRALLPKLEKLMNYKDLLELLKQKKALKLVGWEQEKEKQLADFAQEIKKSQEIYLIIGPEGGFISEEIGLAEKSGCQAFSLGRLILRSEIAGLVTSAFIFQSKSV